MDLSFHFVCFILPQRPNLQSLLRPRSFSHRSPHNPHTIITLVSCPFQLPSMVPRCASVGTLLPTPVITRALLLLAALFHAFRPDARLCHSSVFRFTTLVELFDIPFA